MVYRSIMIIPCPLEQSIDESTFFKPWKSLPLLFASNSGLVNSRSYNVWKSSTVFHCHLFSLEFRFSSSLFVETNRIRSVSRESVRFEAKWSKMLGQIVGKRSWQKLPDLRLKWEQIGSWTSTWNHPSVIFVSCFRCNGRFHISEMESCSTHWLWPDVCYSYVALSHRSQTSW